MSCTIGLGLGKQSEVVAIVTHVGQMKFVQIEWTIKRVSGETLSRVWMGGILFVHARVHGQ